MMSGWISLNHPPEVVPLNDLKPHVPGEMCGCKPEHDGEVIVHNSYDGRELFERGERKVS